jgi:hypothetical protein
MHVVQKVSLLFNCKTKNGLYFREIIIETFETSLLK